MVIHLEMLKPSIRHPIPTQIKPGPAGYEQNLDANPTYPEFLPMW